MPKHFKISWYVSYLVLPLMTVLPYPEVGISLMQTHGFILIFHYNFYTLSVTSNS